MELPMSKPQIVLALPLSFSRPVIPAHALCDHLDRDTVLTRIAASSADLTVLLLPLLSVLSVQSSPQSLLVPGRHLLSCDRRHEVRSTFVSAPHT